MGGAWPPGLVWLDASKLGRRGPVARTVRQNWDDSMVVGRWMSYTLARSTRASLPVGKSKKIGGSNPSRPIFMREDSHRGHSNLAVKNNAT